MKPLFRESAFALGAWFVPFAMSVCIFPLRQWHRPLFESLMGLTLTANTIVLGLLYLRIVDEKVVFRAGVAGVTWMIVNWGLDLAMFSTGPMKMPLNQYLMNIAAAYLVIPVMTVGLGVAMTGNLSQEKSQTSGSVETPR